MADNLHKYFKRKPSEWCVTGFLDECKTESFDRKIDQYLRCLNAIIDCKYERNKRQEKAMLLLKRYKEVKSNFLSEICLGYSGVTGTRSVLVIQGRSLSHKTSVGAQVARSVA